jgi:uncharacterized membrane protein YkoI
MKRMLYSMFAALTVFSAAWAMKPAEDEGGDESIKMTLAQAPPVVQKAIQAAAGSATVSEVEKETEDGITLYEAAWEVGGVEHEVNVNEAGEVMETEMTITADAVPAAVKAAAMKHLPKGTTPEFEKKVIVLYEIIAMVDGKEIEFLVDPSGRVMEVEADDDHEEHEGEDDDEEGDE